MVQLDWKLRNHSIQYFIYEWKDVAIQNPTANEIKLQPTTRVVIGVNEIVPLPSSEGIWRWISDYSSRSSNSNGENIE